MKAEHHFRNRFALVQILIKQIITNLCFLTTSRAFVSWEKKTVIDPKEEHAPRANLEEYKSMLVVRSQVLPDTFTQRDWFNETG